MTRNWKLLLSTAMGLGAVASALPATAQDTDQVEAADAVLPEQDATRGSQIVVTARKREENLIDVPLAITVATQEQLQRDQVYSLNDLQRVAPALEISQTSGGETNGGGRLRGIGTGVFNPSVASSVAFVIDQVPIGNLSFPILYDIAQVEVLRGPQGTLFGQGASGGVINVTTRAPSFAGVSANASLDYADKGTAGSEVGEAVVNTGFNLPLGDTLAVRVSSQFKQETGLQRSVTTGRDNEIETWGVRARVLFEPTDWLSATLNAEHGESTSDGQTFFAIAVAPNSTVPFGPPGGTLGGLSTAAYTNPAGCGVTISERAEEYCEAIPSFNQISVDAISGVLDLELSDSLSLTSVTAFRQRSNAQLSIDFSRITTSPAARQERTQEDSNGFSQELRLTYGGTGFDVVGGAFYTDFAFDRTPIGGEPFTYGSRLEGERIGFSVCTANGSFCAVPPRFTKETTENRTIAGFVDATLELTEQFDVFGGLRYDNYENTTTVQFFPAVPGTPGAPSMPSTFVTEDDNISGRIGVSFQPTRDTNFYASYARGYKPPAVGTNPAGQLFQLEPEKTNAYEVGAKLAVGNLQLSANAFYTELLDFQSQTSVFVGTALVSQPLNIDKIKSKGFELSAFGEVFPGLSLNGGYQYNDIKYPDGYLGDGGGNLGGTQFLNAPKHKASLSADYGLMLSDSFEFFVNANVVYKSEVLLASRADPRYRYPAHELINGGVGLRHPDGNWTASLFVRNLTKEREPTAYLASTFAGQVDGGIRAWPVAGLTARVVGIRLGFEY